MERNSSIFSFESLGELRDLSRASRLRILAGFAAAIALWLGGFSFLRHALVSWYWGDPRTEVLFVGTSHVLDGIQPPRMAWPTSRLWGPGVDQALLTRSFLRHRARWPALEVVLLELDERTLLEDRVWTERDDLTRITGTLDLDAWELPLRDRDRIPFLAKNLARGTGWSAMHPTHRLGFTNFWTLFAPPPGPWKANRPPLPGVVRTSSLSVTLSREGIAQVRAESARDPAYNLTSLIALVRAMRAEGLKVILLTTPNHAYYRDVRPKEWDRMVYDAVARVRSELGEEIPHWDDRADPRFSDDDFNNATHLDTRGAARYTDLLSNRLACQGFLRGECTAE